MLRTLKVPSLVPFTEMLSERICACRFLGHICIFVVLQPTSVVMSSTLVCPCLSTAEPESGYRSPDAESHRPRTGPVQNGTCRWYKAEEVLSTLISSLIGLPLSSEAMGASEEGLSPPNVIVLRPPINDYIDRWVQGLLGLGLSSYCRIHPCGSSVGAVGQRPGIHMVSVVPRQSLAGG